MLCYWAKTPLDYIQGECAMCYMRDISMPDYPANSEGKCHISPAENVVIRPQKMPTILWVSLILYFSVCSRYYRHYASLPKNINEFCNAIQCMAYTADNTYITQRNQLNTASILPSSEIQIILNPHWMDEAHSFSFSARWNIRVYSQLVRKRPTNDYIPIPNACIYGMFRQQKSRMKMSSKTPIYYAITMFINLVFISYQMAVARKLCCTQHSQHASHRRLPTMPRDLETLTN